MVNQENFFRGNSQESPELPGIQTPDGELYLRFFLPCQDEFVLPAAGIREVMQQSPDRITAIPNASPLLLGTINLRGQIIWVADLGQFLGDSTALNTDRSEIPVIAIEDQETILGLAIDRLGEMEWLDLEHLQISTTIPDQIAPFVQGEWINPEEYNPALRLLNHVAIIRSARWAA